MIVPEFASPWEKRPVIVDQSTGSETRSAMTYSAISMIYLDSLSGWGDARFGRVGLRANRGEADGTVRKNGVALLPRPAGHS